MANPNLTRIHQKIFSENAANNGQFGSLQAGTIVENPNIATLQALPAYQEGWSDAVISGEELPSLEEFNGLHKIETEQLQYLLNKGIPEYSADAEYYIGDIQREVGGTKLYKSITDNNIGNALTDTLNWEIYYDPDNSIFDNVTINNILNTQPNPATILNDEITVAGSYMIIDTEGGAATDDLATINGGNDGDILIIRTTNNARDITVKHGTGNIVLKPLEQDVFLDFENDRIVLQYKQSNNSWEEVSRSVESDFKNSKATNGYTYLPNGLIMQWGTFLYTGGINGTQNISLPLSYTTSHFQTLVTQLDYSSSGNESIPAVPAVGLSNFTIRSGVNNWNYRFWSIGY